RPESLRGEGVPRRRDAAGLRRQAHRRAAALAGRVPRREEVVTPLHELKRLRAAWRANVPLPMNVVLVVAAIYLLLKLVRPVIPGSVILLYMGFAVAGALIHVTLDDARIRRFVAFF